MFYVYLGRHIVKDADNLNLPEHDISLFGLINQGQDICLSWSFHMGVTTVDDEYFTVLHVKTQENTSLT